MTGFITSVVVALLGTILFAIATRYEGAYSTAKIETPVNNFVSSTKKFIWNGSATEGEIKQLWEYIEDIETARNKIRSIENTSASDVIMYALWVFPFNTFILIDFAFGGSSGMAFLYTVLTYVFAAIFIAVYGHIKTTALEVQEENAHFDKLKNELSAIPSDSDFSSLQKHYYKLSDMIYCAGKLSHLSGKSSSAHNVAGILSLISLVLTIFFSI